jgi:hypothetical protein
MWEQTERTRLTETARVQQERLTQLQDKITHLQSVLENEVGRRDEVIAHMQREGMVMQMRLKHMDETLRLRENTRERMAYAHESTLEKVRHMTARVLSLEQALAQWENGSLAAGLVLDMCDRAMVKACRDREYRNDLDDARLAVDLQALKLMAENDGVIGALETALETALIQSSKREEVMRGLEKKLVEGEQQNRAHAMTIDTLQKALKGMHDKFAESTNVINKLRGDLSGAKTSTKDTERTFAKEKERAERAEAKHGEVLKALKALEKDKDAITAKCGEAERECARLKGEVQRERDDKEREIREKEREVKDRERERLEREREREVFEEIKLKLSMELRAAQTAGVYASVFVCVHACM